MITRLPADPSSKLFQRLLALTWLCVATTGHAQNAPFFSRLSVEHGLSATTITSIIDDSKGYLWVGTDNGLNRYNGYSFKTYFTDPDNENTLIGNSIQQVFEDSRQTLWVSTSGGGLHRYDRLHDVFLREPGTEDWQLNSIYEDANNRLWCVGNVIESYDMIKNQWRQYKLGSPLILRDIEQESDDEFWLSETSRGLYKWDMSSNTVTHFPHDPKDASTISDNRLNEIIKDKHGNLWFGSENGLNKMSRATKKVTRFQTTGSGKGGLPVNVITNLLLHGDSLWLGTQNGGIVLFDTEHETFQTFRADRNNPGGLTDNSIWALHRDKVGRLWIGTYSFGLCKIDPYENKFSYLPVPMENTVVNAILKDSHDRLWIGTEGGLIVNDHGKIMYYLQGHSPYENGTPVLCLFEDDAHHVWVGTWTQGVFMFDENLKSTQFTKTDNPRSLGNPNVFSIAQHPVTHEMLIGSYDGFYILESPRQKTFKQHNDLDNFIKKVFVDSRGRVVIGTTNGVKLFDLATKKFTPLYQSAGIDSLKLHANVNCIIEDHDHTLWVGTKSGMYHLLDNERFELFTRQQGLLGNDVNGILEDRSANLWISSNKGVTVLNRKSLQTKVYDAGDGLLITGFKPSAYFASRDGQFYFGGSDGINSFYPEQITDNPHPPMTLLEDLKIFNRSIKVHAADSILDEQISETREITIPYQYNFITIDYVGLNLSASDKNQYAYRMKGVDADWNYVAQMRQAVYTKLAPGDYEFQVKASNNDRVWSRTPATLIIHLLPPWWQTAWFRLFFVFAVLSVCYLYYRVRVRRLVMQKVMLQGLIKEKTYELQGAYDEITRYNLDLIKNQNEISAQNEELVLQQEEIASQRDTLFSQNKRLSEAQEIIGMQNEEIRNRNESLEEQVRMRTQELRDTNRGLQEYNQQLEQFSFMVAHNLRAPVARALGLINVMRIDELVTPQNQYHIDKMYEAIERLNEIIGDLNVVLSIKKGVNKHYESIDLQQKVDKVRQILESQITESRAEFTIDFSAGHTIYSIRSYIENVFYNLISNAIKYRDPAKKCHINIYTLVSNGRFGLCVSDNGVGIDLDKYSSDLFKIYHRFHTHVEGKGLGLYMVKTQLEALGGEIVIDSKPYEGTTITLFFDERATVSAG